MKKSGFRRQIERITYDKRTINEKAVRIKKSFDEVNNIINGGNNKKK